MRFITMWAKDRYLAYLDHRDLWSIAALLPHRHHYAFVSGCRYRPPYGRLGIDPFLLFAQEI